MGQRLVMNFPTDLPTKTTCSSSLVDAIGIQPISCLKGTTDILFIYRQESDVASILPNYNALNLITGVRGVIITAPGNDCDFVSRFFAPAVGVNEDPVTGSAHTVLFPYWAKKLGKTELMAKQISKRGGHIWGRLIDDRVEISGHAVTFFKGSITLS
jgi:predicted PhzF superfamily epimerase YddE/YHI9